MDRTTPLSTAGRSATHARIRPKRARITNRGAALFALGALFCASFSNIHAATASVLFVLTALITLATLSQPWRRIPGVLLILLAYVAGYAAPVLLFSSALDGLTRTSIDVATQWALRGMIAFSVAYLVVANRSDPRMAVAEPKSRDVSLALFTLLTIGSVSILAWVTNVAVYGIGFVFIEGQNYSAGNDTARQILHLLIGLKYSYVLGYMLLRSQRRPSRKYRLVLYAVLATALVDIVAMGSKGLVMRLAAVVVLGLLLGNARSLGWKKIVGGMLGAAVCLLSFFVITQYRQIMRSASTSGQDYTSLATRSEAFQSALTTSLQPDQQSGPQGVTTEDIGSRLGSGLHGLGWLVQLTNGQSPHENAIKSFFTPIYALLPRFVFPGKPVFFNSGRFASEYFGWSYGGISVSLTGSLYFAWGYVGILGGMFVLGAALAMLENKILKNGFIAMVPVVCFTLVTLHVLDTGAEFQPVLVNLTRILVLLVATRIVWRILYSRSTLGFGNHRHHRK